jgi:SAM-dependent methyltransferase
MHAAQSLREPPVSSFASDYGRYDRMMCEVGHALLDRAAIGEHDHVLDVGCGAGTLSLAAAAMANRVVGLDTDADCVAVARGRAARRGLTRTRFVVADAAAHAFDAPFHVVLSRMGSMHFAQPVAAYEHLRRSLVPGGRLAFVCGGPREHNEWATLPIRTVAAVLGDPGRRPEASGPFALSDPHRIRQVLGEAGFAHVELELLEDPVCLGDDVSDALEFFARTDGGRLLASVDDATRRRLLEHLEAALAPHAWADGVWLPASFWLVTARRPEGAVA